MKKKEIVKSLKQIKFDMDIGVFSLFYGKKDI